MLDLDALLQPIVGDSPSGQDLRSSPVYLQIREARRQEEEVAQGIWRREVKKADYPLVVRLASEALQHKGKELQIAAWLTEASIHVDGLAGLRAGTQLLIGLLEQFWDTVYPAPDDDGDLEFRATPLAWIATQLESPIRGIPLASNGFSWLDYHEAKSIPTEGVAERDSAQRAIRLEAINRQRPTPEDIDDAFLATSAADYDRLLAEVAAAQDAVGQMSEVCDRRFGDVAPSFVGMQETLADIAQTVRVFRGRLPSHAGTAPSTKREPTAPVPVRPPSSSFDFDDWGDPVPDAAPPAVEPGFDAPVPEASATRDATVRSQPAPAVPVSADPFEIMAGLSLQLRESDIFSPASYLLVRGARWGELYANGPDLDPNLLEAPPAETRIELRRLWLERQWDQLLQATERAAVLPCGRGWLDLQRYTVRAAEQCGFDAIARAVQTQLAALLGAYPSLIDATLNDDTPAANAETREWLEREVIAKSATAGATTAIGEPPANHVPPPDLFSEALQVARRGRFEQAFELLSANDGQVPSGRGRFLGRLRLAELCLTTGREAIAEPILRDLVEEIERRKLSDWEGHSLLAQILSSLYRCSSSADEEIRQRLYSQICCLDPVRALALESP